MKNTLKRVLSGMFCLMLLLSFCSTAFASEPQTGTLTAIGETKHIGRPVSAYQLFTIEKETVKGETTYIYTLNSKYEGFFKELKTADNKAVIEGFADMTAGQKSDAAFKYVKALGESDSTPVQDFADAFITWINGQNPVLAADKTAEMAGVKAEGANEEDSFVSSAATIEEVAYGYYLVFVGNAPASLVNVYDDTNSVKVKAEYPTVDKKVEGQEATSAEIGKKVTYTLTSKVPDMDGYTSYVFNFKDTLSNGLTFNDDVKVTIDGTELTQGNDYTVTFNQATNSFVVEMKNMINRKADTGKEIVVTYSATVNENAVIGKPNSNEATVEYSNDPTGDSKGESTPEVVEVYTFDIDLKKVAHGTNAPLSDATFELYESNADDSIDEGKLIKLYKIDDTHFRVATPEEIASTDETVKAKVVTSVTTGATGIINIKGLKAGTYYLKETVAPTGYNPLTTPVKVKIVAEYNDDGTLSTWYVNPDGKYDELGTGIIVPKGTKEVLVENHSGATLPGTGAIGTAVFAAVGVGLVIGGTQLMGRKKKSEESDQ